MGDTIQKSGRELLRRELERRCRNNPHYSLRAFAKSLGLSHPLLSLVLSGKRALSERSAEKVAARLGLNPRRRNALVASANLHHRRGSAALAEETSVDRQYERLSMDTFAVISEWHYYAILSFLELPGAELEPKVIARRLRLSEIQAKIAIDRLVGLSLVAQDGSGRWRQTGKPIKIDNAHSTSATRAFYKGLLGKAAAAIDEHPVEDRDLSSITLAMDASQLPYARKRIRDFRRELTLELEAKGRPNAVFEFMIQLFPLTDPHHGGGPAAAQESL